MNLNMYTELTPTKCFYIIEFVTLSTIQTMKMILFPFIITKLSTMFCWLILDVLYNHVMREDS